MALVLAACGGDNEEEFGSESNGGESGSESASETDELADAVSSAMGAGGGGILIFDGEEIPIESVFCSFHGDSIDVGTISESGHRVLIGTNSVEVNPIHAQILDPDFLQWFPEDWAGDQAQRDGNTFTSDPGRYFNNSDDRIVEASFTVECP